jgi:quinoprotein glucose dehydrogenase
MPGVGGGATWTGAAFDPDSGRLYVPSFTLPFSVTLGRPPAGPARIAGRHAVLFGPRRLMLTKPPYGRITSIDLTTGDHAFAIPVGEGPRRHPALAALDLPRLGWPLRTHVLLTKTLLIAGQEGYRRDERLSARGFASEFELVTLDPALQAFDKATGALIAAVALPANATGAPMTYIAAGRQYIVLAVGGSNVPAELVALRLP